MSAAFGASDAPDSEADPTTFVLVEPSHAGNVGAVARAMKVMGFARLVLVRPRRPGVQREAEALAMASGATDVLHAAREVATLADALHGATWVAATAMTPRDFGPPTHAPREHLPAVAAAGHRAAFVFGPERTGLANDDVYRCHACLTIPTHPGYGSLNLAQAVQLLAYEWRQALGGFVVVPRTAPWRWADAAAVQGLLEHWQRTLVHIGFLDPAAPKKLLPRLNQLLNRARVTDEEVHILRGIARAAGQSAEQSAGRETRDDPAGPDSRDTPGGPAAATSPNGQQGRSQKG